MTAAKIQVEQKKNVNVHNFVGNLLYGDREYSLRMRDSGNCNAVAAHSLIVN